MSPCQLRQALRMTLTLYLAVGHPQGQGPLPPFPRPEHDIVRQSATAAPHGIPTLAPPSQVLICHSSVLLSAVVFGRIHCLDLRPSWPPFATFFSSPLLRSRPRLHLYLMQQAETWVEFQSMTRIYNGVTPTYISEAFSNIVFIISFLRFSVIKSGSRLSSSSIFRLKYRVMSLSSGTMRMV